MAEIPDYVRNAVMQSQSGGISYQPPPSATPVDPSLGDAIIGQYGAASPYGVPAPMPSGPMVQPPTAPSWLQSGISQAAPGYDQTAAPPPMPPPIVAPGTAAQAAQAAAAPQIQEPQAAPPPDNGALPSLFTQAARGSSSYRPEGIGKAGEQWSNVSPSAMPGDVPGSLPNRYLPGVDDPTQDEILNAKLLPGETSADLVNRLATEKAQLRAHPVVPSQYDQAKAREEETQNEALINRRFALSEAAHGADQAAIAATIQGRAQAKEQQRIADDQQRLRNTVDSRVSELDNLIKQHSTASASNPVKNYWSDMGTFGRIGMSIALGFGAAGQALAGGQNVALELINKGIQGEIEKQKGIVDTLGTTIAAKRTLLGDMMAKFLSPQAAELATRASLAGQAESEIRRHAAQEKGVQLRDRMNAEADQLAAQRDDAHKQALEAEHKTLMTWHPAQASGRSGLDQLSDFLNKMGVQPKDKAKVMVAFTTGGPTEASNAMRQLGLSGSADISEGEARGMRMQRGTLVTLPNGDKANALTPEEGDKYRTSLSLLRVFNNNISEMKNIAKTATFVKGARNGNVVAKLKALALQNNAIQKNFLDQGMQDHAEYERTQSISGEIISNTENVVDPTFDPQKYLDDLQRIANKGLLDKITPNLTNGWNSQVPYKNQVVTRPVK